MKKAVFISASPNTEKDDFFTAVKVFLTPWNWNRKLWIEKFEQKIKEKLNVAYVHTFDSGRSGIYVTLKSLGIGEGDEVILPSFTCLVVANAVSWTGATPIFLDTSKSDFNSDFTDLKNKITPKTKAIFVQHTFGKIVDVKLLKSQIPKNILIIEDWAHTLSSQNKLIGDLAVLTFGIEKVISCVRGGAIITNDENINKLMEENTKNLPNYKTSQAFINLINPIFWNLVLPLYSVRFGNLSLGGAIRFIAFKTKILGRIITKEELIGEKPSNLPSKISPTLSILGINQLQKLEKLNEHRQKIALIYDKYLKNYSDYNEFSLTRVWLRYPISIKDNQKKAQIISFCRSQNVFIGDWYKTPLYASNVTKKAFEKNKFNPTDVPTTLEKCQRVLNLPTSINISPKIAKRIAEGIHKILVS
ncbi:MAG: hypothetical protein KatS3mg085_178 [Candidatus Dojkabacteria bacterium]|nr:MAG: hypothetical protein KatS3mg085_178 [Candidatus Dojkabacteria bacterium]